jgi:acetolactate decarboxylase
MKRLWQSTPSSAFKTGLYGPYFTVGEARLYGDFGVGEYEYLDGEVIAVDGIFYRQTSEGRLLQLADGERLCCASLAPFAATDEMALDPGLTETTIQPVYLKAFGTRNAVFAMRIDGTFSQVTTTTVPRQSEPFATFDKVPHVPFHFEAIAGTMVCFYSPAGLVTSVTPIKQLVTRRREDAGDTSIDRRAGPPVNAIRFNAN